MPPTDRIARAVAAIQADPDLRAYLGMRCGYHPDMLAMSVAGQTVGEVSALYRATLARVVGDEGVSAVDTTVPHLDLVTSDDGIQSIRVVDEAFDIRPMFHGVQLAARAKVAAAASEARLEERILEEVTACLLTETQPPDGPADEFDSWVRSRARASERCTGVVSRLALEFSRSVVGDAVRRADLASASLVDLERMLHLRPPGSVAPQPATPARPLPVDAVF
ncbi:MAG TPA: hypothetical protein VFV93_13745, partial [Thermomicrobiales bacterium]|nr:hypothetical protein [Thermomicrobiales bacterium]